MTGAEWVAVGTVASSIISSMMADDGGGGGTVSTAPEPRSEELSSPRNVFMGELFGTPQITGYKDVPLGQAEYDEYLDSQGRKWVTWQAFPTLCMWEDEGKTKAV